MKKRAVGGITVSRVIEMNSPDFPHLEFFPDTTADDWAPYLDWLQPVAMDPKTGNLRFPMQSYVVRTSHHTILIDTCVGNHKDRPHRPTWHEKTDTTYTDGLAAAGLRPEDIDFVMCTHMHGDHVGWNTKKENGQWVPTFPNARYVFSEKELRVWERENEKTPNQVLVDSVLPVVAAGRAQLVTSDFQLDDEVWLEPTPGHTPDHFAVRFKSNGAEAVMSGDLMHSPVQLKHPEWRARPDWDPAQAQATRRAFLERYCETDVLVCTAHFPLPSAGHIVRAADGFDIRYDESGW